MRKLAFALALACASGAVWTAGTAIGGRPHGPDARRVAAERIEVPIKQVVLPNRGIRYSVTIKIGNASPIDAWLYTGGVGLRVLRTAVPEQAYVASHQSSIYRWSADLADRLVGVIARAVVAIGWAAADKPIPIEVFNSVDCATRLPQCSASRVSAADYRIGGDFLAKGGIQCDPRDQHGQL